ncbi:hypothetical protein MIB92_01270 [Aestuariirhabdus sp. Z084]|uniref:hypothetical protein n=1 Tax=Aestuariirhabdus haliotis TaxID=2918751 RepID=UPI00201B4163|nr:hypothetical protein [Aestuariirhabdus haliotis]MCL6414268.1 hypothetical protein [Aestuariirhabdus haliotis]MCL6418200.1 hypothetical protein [Aestuariirhabdus haliotis]
MSADAIRELIANALQQEHQHQHLAAHLNSLKNGLHPLLGLDRPTANTKLLEFSIQYINYVPEFIEVVDDSVRKSGVNELISPFLSIVSEYFLSPSPAINGHAGLIGLLDEAYLGHRLFEEVNDIFWSRGGFPLIPLDTSQANVIAHAIVGEPFANELDSLVEHAVSGLGRRFEALEQGGLGRFIKEHAQHWKQGEQQWPCLAGEMGLDFKLRQHYLKAI